MFSYVGGETLQRCCPSSFMEYEELNLRYMAMSQNCSLPVGGGAVLVYMRYCYVCNEYMELVSLRDIAQNCTQCDAESRELLSLLMVAMVCLEEKSRVV